MPLRISSKERALSKCPMSLKTTRPCGTSNRGLALHMIHSTTTRHRFAEDLSSFHNPVQPRTYASAYYFNPPYVLGTVIAPSFPSPFASLTAPLPSQTNGVNYHTPSAPYLMQWNLNLQRQVIEATILTVAYVGLRGAHLFNQRDQNPPIPAIGPTGERIYGTLGPT